MIRRACDGSPGKSAGTLKSRPNPSSLATQLSLCSPPQTEALRSQLSKIRRGSTHRPASPGRRGETHQSPSSPKLQPPTSALKEATENSRPAKRKPGNPKNPRWSVNYHTPRLPRSGLRSKPLLLFPIKIRTLTCHLVSGFHTIFTSYSAWSDVTSAACHALVSCPKPPVPYPFLLLPPPAAAATEYDLPGIGPRFVVAPSTH